MLFSSAFFRAYFTTSADSSSSSSSCRTDSASTIASLLKAFSVYASLLRRDELRQISSVGEDVIPTLADLWRQHKNSDALKWETIKCFKFQFELRKGFPETAGNDKVTF